METINAAVTVQKVIKIHKQEVLITDDYVIEEIPLTLFLNDKELVTMLCSPGDEYYLALGFLASEGIIKTLAEVQGIEVNSQAGLIHAKVTQSKAFDEKLFLKRYLTACCGKGRTSFYFSSDVGRVKPAAAQDSKNFAQQALNYVELLEEKAQLFRLTGGVHCGALVADNQIVVYSEDIGRHNVFDKLYGHCLAKDIRTDDKAVVFSGRVSAEIVLKLSKMNIAIIIAKSAPSSLAIDLAEELGITIIGFARRDRLNIYTHKARISY